MRTTWRCRRYGHLLGSDVNGGGTIISSDEVCHRRRCEYRIKDKFLPDWSQDQADFGRETALIGDLDDPLSLVLTLSMNHGAIHAAENADGTWTVNVVDKGSWTGRTQKEALTAAWTDLEG